MSTQTLARMASCACGGRYYCRGLCKSCYQHKWKNKERYLEFFTSTTLLPPKPEVKSECHPDRKHRALGLCDSCYEASRKNSKKEATWRFFGIKDFSVIKYNELLEKQNYVCAICLEKPEDGHVLEVDHDHKTGKVRGLLCSFCNTKLVCKRNTIDILLRAVDYLRQEQQNSEQLTPPK